MEFVAIAVLIFLGVFLFRRYVGGSIKHQTHISTLIENEHPKAVTRSFDESFFINPQTGKFKFPKYKTPASALVPIIDKTNYKETIGWSDFDAEEKRSFTLNDFEHYFPGVENIAIGSFHAFLDRAPKTLLSPFEFIVKYVHELEALAMDWGDSQANTTYCSDGLVNELVNRGFLESIPVESYAEKRRCLEAFKAGKLKDMCKEEHLPVSGNKSAIVERLLNNEGLVFPNIVTSNQSFNAMLQALYTKYTDQIKGEINQWHPLVIAEVWDYVGDEANTESLEKHIESVKHSAYWKS